MKTSRIQLLSNLTALLSIDLMSIIIYRSASGGRLDPDNQCWKNWTKIGLAWAAFGTLLWLICVAACSRRPEGIDDECKRRCHIFLLAVLVIGFLIYLTGVLLCGPPSPWPDPPGF